MEVEVWHDAEVIKPPSSGWYEVKAGLVEYPCYYGPTLGGRFVWLSPTPQNITHWKYR